nr:MAG TPA: hypothetical protein [Caudoviricetes sp.]
MNKQPYLHFLSFMFYFTICSSAWTCVFSFVLFPTYCKNITNIDNMPRLCSRLFKHIGIFIEVII